MNSNKNQTISAFLNAGIYSMLFVCFSPTTRDHKPHPRRSTGGGDDDANHAGEYNYAVLLLSRSLFGLPCACSRTNIKCMRTSRTIQPPDRCQQHKSKCVCTSVISIPITMLHIFAYGNSWAVFTLDLVLVSSTFSIIESRCVRMIGCVFFFVAGCINQRNANPTRHRVYGIISYVQIYTTWVQIINGR